MGIAYPAYFSPRYLEPSHIEEELKHGFLKVRDGHTARVKGYKFSDTLEATINSPFIKIDDNTVVVYNTELDEHLGLSSESKLAEYGKYPSWMNTGLLWKTLVLDKSKRWELVDHLKSIALTQTICRNSCSRDPDEVVFVLPVTGYTVFRTKDSLSKTKKRTKKKGKFFFRNVLYDSKILYYSYKPYEFTPMFKLSTLKRLDPIPGTDLAKAYTSTKGEFRGAKIHDSIELGTGDYSSYYKNRVSYPKEYEGELESINVKFTRISRLSHIDVQGRRLEVSSFPTYEDEFNAFHIPLHRGLEFVTDKSDHWVSKFEIRYWHFTLCTWISLGVFTGNNDRFTQVRHIFKDNFITSDIQIIPKAFVGSPSMQFEIFRKTGNVNEYTDEVPPEPTIDKFAQITADATVSVTVQFPNLKRYKRINPTRTKYARIPFCNYPGSTPYRYRDSGKNSGSKRTHNRSKLHLDNVYYSDELDDSIDEFDYYAEYYNFMDEDPADFYRPTCCKMCIEIYDEDRMWYDLSDETPKPKQINMNEFLPYELQDPEKRDLQYDEDDTPDTSDRKVEWFRLYG